MTERQGRTAAGAVGSAEARADALRVNEAAAALGPLARRLRELGQVDAAALVESWRGWAERPVVVAVVGEVKRGKSTLVNALVGRSVSPTGVDVVTSGEIGISAPTDELAEGEGRLFHDDGSVRMVSAADAVDALRVPGDAGRREEGNGDPRGSQGVPPAGPRPIMAQIAVTPRWLPGAALFDTPGVGGLVGEHAARARATAERSGALLFVSDGGQVLTRPELDFLREVSVSAEYVVFALTKVDRTDGWKTVLEENRRLLAEHAPRFADAPIMPVAAVLAEAAWSQDPDTAAVLERASGVPELAAALAVVTRGQRRVAVAKALRIAVTALESAGGVVDREREAIEEPREAVADLEVEQRRLEELRDRRNYLRVYVERDLARARADALALLNTLTDAAAAELGAQAQLVRNRDADVFTESLRARLRAVVEDVRARFVVGVGVAVEDAFKGLDLESPEPSQVGSVTVSESGEVVVGRPGAAVEPVRRGLSELVPGVHSGASLAGAVELGALAAPRAAAKTSAFDPSMASFAFMGSHLGTVLGLGGPFGPLLAAGWVAVNIASRRSREGRQQLAAGVADSFAVLRRDLPATLDAITRELRPELIVEAERTLERRAAEVRRLLDAAKAARLAEERERRTLLTRLDARAVAVRDQRAHAELLLERLAPTANG
ncbi:dynamin family protein [Oryzobacter telluris]|uniref:dynamin family protein n=1 Tax=Oryzobacter telluris TaxID=3149179 RepID=UPI00370DCA4E